MKPVIKSRCEAHGVLDTQILRYAHCGRFLAHCGVIVACELALLEEHASPLFQRPHFSIVA